MFLISPPIVCPAIVRLSYLAIKLLFLSYCKIDLIRCDGFPFLASLSFLLCSSVNLSPLFQEVPHFIPLFHGIFPFNAILFFSDIFFFASSLNGTPTLSGCVLPLFAIPIFLFVSSLCFPIVLPPFSIL